MARGPAWIVGGCLLLLLRLLLVILGGDCHSRCCCQGRGGLGQWLRIEIGQIERRLERGAERRRVAEIRCHIGIRCRGIERRRGGLSTRLAEGGGLLVVAAAAAGLALGGTVARRLEYGLDGRGRRGRGRERLVVACHTTEQLTESVRESREATLTELVGVQLLRLVVSLFGAIHRQLRGLGSKDLHLVLDVGGALNRIDERRRGLTQGREESVGVHQRVRSLLRLLERHGGRRVGVVEEARGSQLEPTQPPLVEHRVRRLAHVQHAALGRCNVGCLEVAAVAVAAAVRPTASGSIGRRRLGSLKLRELDEREQDAVVLAVVPQIEQLLEGMERRRCRRRRLVLVPCNRTHDARDASRREANDSRGREIMSGRLAGALARRRRWWHSALRHRHSTPMRRTTRP